MNFPFNAYLLALVGAFLGSFLTLPLWRAVCRRAGLVDDPGHRKIHDSTIPLAGGFAVLAGMLAPLFAGAAAVHWHSLNIEATDSPLNYGLNHRVLQLAAIVLGAVVITVVGILDDKFELRPLIKFSGQLLAALLVAVAKVRISLFIPNTVFSYAVTVLWILTVINAFNFIDNMNGLCAGLGVISAWFFAMIAAADGQYLVALLALLTCGALLGFLPYNFPKASAFLGDAGSHLIGYLLAVMGILPHFYSVRHPHVWAVFIPLLILGVPLGDLAWVVLLRWRIGQPFYVGDNNHLSHRLVKSGMSCDKAVLLIWLLSAILGALSLLLFVAW